MAAIKLTWDDLLIEAPALDPRDLLHGWSWLVKGPFRPVAASKFGDWFLSRPDGSIEMVDGIDGQLHRVAATFTEFQSLINTQQKQEEWLLSLLVMTLHEANRIPRAGECYAFKLPPILGGPVESSNVEVMDFRVWVSICGQIHDQTRELPPGTRISGFRTAE